MKIIPKFALVLFILISFFCSKSQKEIRRHIFLLEKMESARIITTPDLNKTTLKKEQRWTLKTHNSDINLPPSPLIKKIKCREETRNVLFAPADSIVDFPLKIGKGAVLEFGFAIDDIYLNRPRFPVEFKVLIKINQEKRFNCCLVKMFFPAALPPWGGMIKPFL